MKVIVIVGYTRSGSTLLDSILGENDGYFSTGELHYLWQRGLLERRRCGCGTPVPECEIWSNVLAAAFGTRPPDPERVMTWQDRCVRTRHTWWLLRGGTGPLGDLAALRAYRSVAGDLYRAIADVTGARVIVDSSKRPSDGALLRLLPGVEPFFVHLVRDPRAIVFSWQRRKKELDADRQAEMPRQPLLQSVIGWSELNIAADALRKAAGRNHSLLLRYEDFMQNPIQAIHSITHLAGEPVMGSIFTDDHTVVLGENHTVAGNPGRFARGSVRLRNDDEWQTRMRGRDLWTTTTLSAPLLRKYEYALSLPRRQSAGSGC